MREEDSVDYIKTEDIDLASVLYCLGFPIDGIYPSGVKNYWGKMKMQFFFRDEKRLQTAIVDYQKRKLRLEPYELFSTRKLILDKVKDEARSQQPKASNSK